MRWKSAEPQKLSQKPIGRVESVRAALFGHFSAEHSIEGRKVPNECTAYFFLFTGYQLVIFIYLYMVEKVLWWGGGGERERGRESESRARIIIEIAFLAMNSFSPFLDCDREK